jgi:uncharacterized membrane-anchored protein YjiN (DUF445 family)
MAVNVVTTEDLQIFRKDLLEDLKKFITEKQNHTVRKWLKSHEVRRLLTISPGTLQNLRVNGTLPFTKIGGVIYYDSEDIQKMLLQNKQVNDRSPFSLEKQSLNRSIL